MAVLDDGTLAAFADGELDATTMRLVADLVARDPAAQEKLRLLHTSTGLLRAAFADPAFQQVPPGLAARVERAVSPGRIGGRRRFVGAVATALAAGVVGFAGGVTVDRGPVRLHPGFSDRLLNEVAGYHVAYAQVATPLDEVPARKTAQIEAWFGGLLHRPFRVPTLAGAGLVFRGARLLVVDGRPVTQLLYSYPGQPGRPLGLCISAGTPRSEALRTVRREGVNLALWGRGGYTFVLVGWVGTNALTTLAGDLRPQLSTL